MIEVTRGASVEFFGIEFRDSDGNATVPDEATLRVRYLECGEEKFAEVELEEEDGLWAGDWDSSVADAGTIYWHITPSGSGTVVDGQFRLKANPANPSSTDA